MKWERLTWAQAFSVAPLCDKEEGMVVRVTEKASIGTGRRIWRIENEKGICEV